MTYIAFSLGLCFVVTLTICCWAISEIIRLRKELRLSRGLPQSIIDLPHGTYEVLNVQKMVFVRQISTKNEGDAVGGTICIYPDDSLDNLGPEKKFFVVGPSRNNRVIPTD